MFGISCCQLKPSKPSFEPELAVLQSCMSMRLENEALCISSYKLPICLVGFDGFWQGGLL